MKRGYLLLVTLGLLVPRAFAAPAADVPSNTPAAAVLQMNLAEAEAQALKQSNRLEAKRFELEAYQSRMGTQRSLAWPRLSLDASFRYITEVPEIAIVPNRPAVPMGDNENYSVGPTLAWTFWDTGAGYFAWKAASAAMQAKEQEVEALTRETRLRTRMAYFQTQMALAQVQLLKDALRLAREQYQDIVGRQRAGAASRMDALSGHQEVLAQERQLRQARTDLIAALRDLLRLTGNGEGLDLSRPAGQLESLPSGNRQEPEPTVRLVLEPLEASLQRLRPSAAGQPDPDHPQARLFTRLAEVNRMTAQSLSMSHWPKLQLSARTSIDYPNGPVLETIHQNTVMVSASWSLFEGGRIANQTWEQESLAKANAQQSTQANEDLLLAWNKAQDSLAGLEEIHALDQKVVKETRELAGLVYDAYRAGRASFLEVESANYRTLGARIQSVRTTVQMLIQLATLDSMAAQPQE